MQQVDDIRGQISLLPPAKQRELLAMLDKLEHVSDVEQAQDGFIKFVEMMWPEFIAGNHHAVMADAFERVAKGELKRLIINLGPRHTKSEFASFLLPAWFLGKFPKKKIIQASNTGDLAVGFGRKVRNLIDSKEYQSIFKNVSLAADSKAAGRWNTNQNGEYFAIGCLGTVTGKGADILIIDDPHSEAQAVAAANNPEIYDKVYEWYTSGPRQRLQPGGSIILVQTRWSKRDLTGQILKNSTEKAGSDQWEVIELPAIMPSGKSLWPEFWSLEELEATKAELPVAKWNAQYMQNPTSEEGALIKREWWKEWPYKEPPKCEGIIQSWDTAFDKTARSDYSACTTWGVFYHPDDKGITQPNLILLHAHKEKLEFPELKKTALRLYQRYEPDQLVVEKKASGGPLIYELRAMGIPVSEFTPSRGNDKFVRINAVADLFASGFVWAPNRRFAEEVIDECSSFPNGENDDLVDSTTQALLRFRQGGWIGARSDNWDDDDADARQYGIQANYY